jgi:hypothetical protein
LSKSSAARTTINRNKEKKKKKKKKKNVEHTKNWSVRALDLQRKADPSDRPDRSNQKETYPNHQNKALLWSCFSPQELLREESEATHRCRDREQQSEHEETENK